MLPVSDPDMLTESKFSEGAQGPSHIAPSRVPLFIVEHVSTFVVYWPNAKVLVANMCLYLQMNLWVRIPFTKSVWRFAAMPAQ